CRSGAGRACSKALFGARVGRRSREAHCSVMARVELGRLSRVAKAKYDGLAEWYDQEQARVAARPDAPLEQFAELAEPAGGLIVELGCGTGLAAAALATRGWQVGGIDISWDQLEIARRRCRWIVQADAHELPVRTAGLCA